METKSIRDKIETYLAELQRGKPTEIDLDGLGCCMSDAIRTIEDCERQAESAAMFRDDLISEVVRLSRAASALLDGVSTFDPGKLQNRLSSCDASSLLALRRNVRTGFARLMRSHEMPRRTVTNDYQSRNLSDYRLDDRPALISRSERMP